ncbi:MAG: glycosyltransferase, partial [Sphingobacterium sp.]
FLQADGIQILFESYHQFLPNEFQGIAQSIPNPIDQSLESQIVEHQKKKDRYKIINLASLNTSCKQQHLAISVFAAIQDQYPDWDLEFWGIGDDQVELAALIQQYSLSDRVFLRGFTDRPGEILLQSDIFLFLSKYEGFPLALGEAMSAGLPCIGLADCSGVNELIIDQQTGFLVNNLHEAEKVLVSLIADANLRTEMGRAGHERMKNYQEQRVFKGWEALIQRVIQDSENKY